MDELTPQQCYELLRSEQVGHLAVVSGGEPYVTPVSYVVSDKDIAMRVGEGRRVRAVKENPRASFEVSNYNVETGNWRSVIVAGNLRISDDDQRIQAVIAGLINKYRPVIATFTGRAMPLTKDVVLVLEIEDISGRSSGNFFSLRSRPGRL